MVMSPEVIAELIEEEYGCSCDELFYDFEWKPLGSASIAQVHKAKLKDGQDIVVKVQRPHIYATMERDIALVRRASNILKLSQILGNIIDINMVLDEFWATAKEEMDFLEEARYARKFQELHKDLQYIGVPHIYSAYSTSRVLVMEYIEGIAIDDVDTLQKEGYDLEEIAAKLADNYVKQIVDDGFFHGDPHPGNIRIRDGHIIWIDFGMMGQLTSRDQELIKNGIMAMAENDAGKLTDVILALGVHNGKVDYAQLYGDMEILMGKYLTMELSEINLGEAIQEVFTIAHQHNISVPKGVSLLAKGLVTIESTISILDPKTNIIKIAAAHMSKGLLSSFDMRKELKSVGRKSYGAVHKALDIPVQLSQFLKMAMKGQVKVNLEIMDSIKPLSTIDEMVNKMIVCIEAAALLIGSSLICTTNMTPRIFGIPLLGFMGYMGAVLLGVWMLFHTHIGRK